MARGVRSARGEIVDFDLLRIKENLGQAPKASTVKAREDFIDQKFKRRLRRMTETVAQATTAPQAGTAQPQPAQQVAVQTPVVEEPVVEVEDISADTEVIEAPVEAEPTKKKIIKPAGK